MPSMKKPPGAFFIISSATIELQSAHGLVESITILTIMSFSLTTSHTRSFFLPGLCVCVCVCVCTGPFLRSTISRRTDGDLIVPIEFPITSSLGSSRFHCTSLALRVSRWLRSIIPVLSFLFFLSFFLSFFFSLTALVGFFRRFASGFSFVLCANPASIPSESDWI